MDQKQLEQVLGTVCTMLEAEGMDEAADLVRSSPARAELTGHDNWNGGTELWEIVLSVPAAEFARLGSKRQHLEEQVGARFKATIEQLTQDWYSVKIAPEVVAAEGWRSTGSLPRGVRQDIIDGMRLEDIDWHGSLDDVEFLQRLFDLQKLPSRDHRFKDAAGDIWQHRINNDDWERDWIFTDNRFNLTGGPAEVFLRFLREVIHPVVRPSRDEALRLASHFNDQLRPQGWELYEEQRIAGRQRFAYRRTTHNGTRAVTRARTVADALDAGWMEKEIERLERSIDRDPALAIGTAKELVETCCKTILTKREVAFRKGADLADLTKLVAKELKLVPEGISDEAKGAENIRLILRNLTSLTHNLAQLRGLYGTGHGRDGSHRGLQARHARLAVGSAVAFIDFVADTLSATRSSGGTGQIRDDVRGTDRCWPRRRPALAARRPAAQPSHSRAIWGCLFGAGFSL